MYLKACRLFLITLVLGSMVSLSSCYPWPLPSRTHTPENLSGIDELWSRSNVYADSYPSTPMMVATEGKVLINGALIIGLDGLSGEELWHRYDQFSATALTAAPDAFYVGYSGVPHVIKFKPSGDIIWSQYLSGRGLGPLFIVGNEVQVSTDPFIFTVLDKENGQIKNQRKGNDIYIVTPDTTFMPRIQAIETSTGKVIWQRFDFDRELQLPPIFLIDKILIRTGRISGSIYMLDRFTGETIWKTEDNIISSIAYSPFSEKVYALTREGSLLAIDEVSGEQSVIAEFSSAPFVIHGVETVGGYEIAFDDSTQNLYVLLGDSRQVFAFKVK
jgi:outer membrane protein assembly factor BamB